MRRGITALFAVLALRTASAQAQPNSGPAQFDVASLKRAASPGGFESLHGGPGTSDPELASAISASLNQLLQRAYGLKGDQILGPGWLSSEFYDLKAKVPPGTTSDQFAEMLRNLLIDRFRITMHRDTKVYSGYQLLVASTGAKLKEVDGPARRVSYSAGNGKTHVVGRSTSMEFFADALGRLTNIALAEPGLPPAPNAHVLDHTNLTKLYDFEFEFGVPGANGFSDSPNLFASLQQLGLKLEGAKLSLDVIVIDKADKTPISD